MPATVSTESANRSRHVNRRGTDILPVSHGRDPTPRSRFVGQAPHATARRWLPWLAVAAVLLPLCLLFGAAGIGLPDTATPTGRAILMLRANRVLCGFITGATLAVAGTILQAVLRNPLAEPYVLGVSSGAALGAAAAILAGVTAWSQLALPLAAFVGGSLTLLAVYAIAHRVDAGASIYGLILSGVIVSSVCSSLLMFLISAAPVEGLHSVMWWMLGNLQPTSLPLLHTALFLLAAGLVVAWLLAPQLNALALGAETAHHVGIRLGLLIPLALAVATFLTAVAVSLAGLIGFVGLLVPHVTRHVTGADHRRLLPGAALAGGVFLAVCDALARSVMAPAEIPVGVITALLGGPCFLILMRRRGRRSQT